MSGRWTPKLVDGDHTAAEWDLIAATYARVRSLNVGGDPYMSIVVTLVDTDPELVNDVLDHMAKRVNND
jgi:hypothetical protein